MVISKSRLSRKSPDTVGEIIGLAGTIHLCGKYGTDSGANPDIKRKMSLPRPTVVRCGGRSHHPILISPTVSHRFRETSLTLDAQRSGRHRARHGDDNKARDSLRATASCRPPGEERSHERLRDVRGAELPAPEGWGVADCTPSLHDAWDAERGAG